MAIPPSALPAKSLTVRLPAGTIVTRVHWADKGPIWFGPAPGEDPTNRFDAPASEFRTLYASENLAGGFVETVLRKARRIIARPEVYERAWSLLRLRRDVELVQLHGAGLIHHGVTNDICAGDSYSRSQQFALNLHQRYGLDGIAYRARHNNDEICYAINDGVDANDLGILGTYDFKDFPHVASELLDRHGAMWDPMIPLAPAPKI